jgi:hypothetical protein
MEREVLLDGYREDQRYNMPTNCLVLQPFQRSQYLETSNPINTPIVFASMS